MRADAIRLRQHWRRKSPFTVVLLADDLDSEGRYMPLPIKEAALTGLREWWMKKMGVSLDGQGG